MSDRAAAGHVAVAVVAYRNPADVSACLRALEGSTHRDFEVVICENGGREAFARLTAALPNQLAGGQPVRIIDGGGNLGFAGGVNRCLAASPDAEAWWILNPDAAPETEAMGALLGRLRAGDCDAVGCIILLPGGRVQSFGGLWRFWLARAVSLGYGASERIGPDPARIEARQNYLNGASMMVSRRFVDVAGPMREDYFLYAEEVEWCLRARERGLRLGFAPAARVLHRQGSTTGAITHIARRARTPVYLNVRNSLLVTRDRRPGLLGLATVTSLVGVLLRYPRRGAWRQLFWALSGWLAGVRGERGRPAWIAP
ncbi:MAG TPA: glycosyltransferase family 2 protein [Caulobacteraceae bacterium]|nr:glycosyltransferase family 2 protein [Caulobacteraceae bacterium]